MLAAGPRQLGQVSFGAFALAWTVSTVFGLGVAAPFELLQARRINANPSSPRHRAVGVLVILAALSCGFMIAFSPQLAANRSFPGLAWSAVFGIAGWTVVTIVRSRLAGAGDLVAYSAVLFVEASARGVLVLTCFAFPGATPTLFGLAVGGPLVLAAAAGIAVRVDAVPAGQTDDPGSSIRGEAISFVCVSLGYQLCLSAPPLLLGWKSHSEAATALVGQFVAANSYFRLPTVLMGGFATHALVALSYAWGTGDRDAFRGILRDAIRGASLTTSVVAVALAVAAPIFLPLYYGDDLRLSPVLFAALALSTVVSILSAVLVQGALAAGRGTFGAASWLAGSLVTLGPFAFSSGTDVVASTSLVAGPTVALLGILYALRLVHRRSFGVGRGHRNAETADPI